MTTPEKFILYLTWIVFGLALLVHAKVQHDLIVDNIETLNKIVIIHTEHLAVITDILQRKGGEGHE